MSGAVHIVVVDDEPDIRIMLSDYLGHAGFRVSTAEGGAAMRQLLAEESADLVILDITMPGEDGLSLARFLREHTKGVGIVMLTAAGGVVDRIVGLEMGADDYIAKPVDLRELLARVRSVLRRLQLPPLPEVAAETRESARSVRFGAFHLDLEAHRLYAADGTVCSISPTTATGSLSIAASTSGSPGSAARSKPIRQSPR